MFSNRFESLHNLGCAYTFETYKEYKNEIKISRLKFLKDI